MDAPAWIAPLTGVVALGSSLSLFGVYAYGQSFPEEHRAVVSATLPTASADDVWALLTDFEKRPTWRPRVDRIARLPDESGREIWRELDAGDDRFDFRVIEEARPRLVLGVARPEDIGMRATWTYTVEPADSGAVVTVSEEGQIDNPFFRGWWWLITGPWAGIEPDLRAIGETLGSEVVLERNSSTESANDPN